MLGHLRFALAAFSLAFSLASLPCRAAELAQPNGIEEGFALWSSSAEYRGLWDADPPRNPWLMADAVASTYDVGTRALQAGDSERAYRLWLSLAQAGNCRAKFAVGYLLDPASPAALATVTVTGRIVPAEERAATAFAWYLPAAEEGWPAAQRLVGEAYADGKVVLADPAAAKLWYRRAARNMEPAAMLALARAFLHADTSAERVEGLTWALIARDDRSLFWFDDTEAAALATAYEQAMPEGEIASARQTAALWWSIDYAIWKDYSKDELPNIEASRRMFRDLAPMETSPAARFDAGALAYLEGRNHDAFLAWWPLAKRGYCQAQFAAGSLLQWLRPAVAQPLSYQWDGEPFSHDHATTTALAHAAMQGVVYAQVLATYVSIPGVIIVPSLEAASSRWEDRAGAQGELKAVNPFNYRREDGIP